MQSSHCQARVSKAVKEVEGVQIQNLEPGKITVSIESEKVEIDVASAIRKAGYTVLSEVANDSPSSCSSNCCST